MCFPTDDANCLEPEVVAGCCGCPDVVGEGAPDGQQPAVALLLGGCQVVLELAPLVAGYFGMDEVITLEVQPDARPYQAVVLQLGQG